MILLLSLCIAACLIFWLDSWLKELKRKQEPPPTYLPAVVEQDLVPAPEIPPTRSQVIIRELAEDIKILADLYEFEVRLQKEHPELLEHPVGGRPGETVGSVVGRRLWQVRTQTITRKPD